MNRLQTANSIALFCNQATTMDAKRTAMQEELRGLLETWENENENNHWDVNPILKRMSEMLEEATNDYLQQNPDPMDERHPIKTHPFRPLGHLLKMIIRNEIFLGKLAITYLIRENTERNVLAARLMLNLLPAGIITNDVFKDAAANSLFTQLFRWAESSDSRELRSYSMALLGAGMGAEQAHQYRQNNFTLIPIALQRLKDLYTQMIQQYQSSTASEAAEQIGPVNFAQFHQEEQEKKTNPQGQEIDRIEAEQNKVDGMQTTLTRKRHSERGSGMSPPPKRSNSLQHLMMTNTVVSPSAESMVSTGSSIRDAWNMLNSGPIVDLSDSNSSWRRKMQPLLVGTHQLYPLTIEMEQRLILHYLTPTSEYQDNVSVLLENHALNVALNYLAMDGPNHVCRDIRLLFDAIRYISALLMHRKFAWEFVQGPIQGIQQLLRINRESMALTAVATCLYYLAYSTDIMEKVCHLPDHVLDCIMDYALYSLDHSHDSGRSSIAMFLGYSLYFRPILDRFDQRDGLRRLYNYCSTLKIMQKDDNTEEDSLDEINNEHYTLNILTLRNAIFAFKCYLQSHLFLKMEHMKRSQSAGRHHQLHRLSQIPHTIPFQSLPHSKPMSMDDETERNCLEYLIQSQCMFQAHNQNWKPIEEMRNLGIFEMLFRIINNYPDWLDYERQGRAETLKLALDVLRLSTVSPKVMLDACDTLIIKKTPTQGLSMILELVDGEILDDSQIQRSSLEMLINCLCNPIERGNLNQNFPLELPYRFGKDFSRDILPEALASKFPQIDSSNLSIIESTTRNSLQIDTIRNQKMSLIYPQPSSTLPIDNKDKAIKLYLNSKQIQQILWKCAQQNNAIMILTSLLHKKEPPTDADNLRELACHALNGLARYEPIRQILSKLPIIAANELNALIQSPVLIEKRMEHNRFCEQARQLIELVSQSKLRDFATMEMTQENLWRAAVVSQTRIKFNEKELLQLIYQHLADKGYKRAAKQLVLDAELPNIPASRIPSTPESLPGFPRQNESTFANIIARRCLFKNNNISLPSASLRLQPVASTSTALTNKPTMTSSSSIISTGQRLPLKLHSTPFSSPNTGMVFSNTSFTTPLSSSANTASTAASFSLKIRPRKSLSEIVQSYFRNEHAICRNPVANCPPFSLFYPHRCPEPKLLYSAPVNFVSRLQCRSNLPYRCSMETLRQADRRLVYSRFRNWKTFSEENELITCCQFSQNDEHIFLGTYAGDMFVYNVRTGAVDANYNCNQSAIMAIHTTKNSLMLTSSVYVKPYSVLWRMDETGISVAEKLVDFNEDHYLEFGNLSTHRIVGTQGPKAIVYDTETAQPVVSLFEERLANHYTRNRAYFDPLDELVLNDGILFDPRIGQCGRVIHKFDKMNLDNSGVFHPRGTEVIINREIWDLRTHRLLHTVPALDQCQLAFNSTGTILFGIVHQPDPSDVDDRLFAAFGNYFRTLDANNYEVISTYEIKRPLLDLCCSHSDNYIGVIETGRIHEDTNFLKLYEVGRRRDREADEDEDDEADQNQDDDEENDGYSSSGSTTQTVAADSITTIFIGAREGDDENNEPIDGEVEAIIDEEMEDEEEDTDDDDSSYSDEDYVELSSDDFSL